MIGLASAVLAFATYGLAPTQDWFFIGIPLGALSALIGPGIQSLMSRRVPANEQGRLQGVNSAFMGLCAIVGPIIYLSTLAFAVRQDPVLHQPGIPIISPPCSARRRSASRSSGPSRWRMRSPRPPSPAAP